MTIYESIIAIMGDVEAIKKDKNNHQQGFKFRGIDDVYNAVHPLFAKHGVFSVPYVEDERTEERLTKSGSNLIYRILTIRYTFFATDGTSVVARVIGEGMDSGDKASNKAMAIAHKYAILQVLCIPTEDMVDPDIESHEASKKVANQEKKQQKPPEPKPEPEQSTQPSGWIAEPIYTSVDGYRHLCTMAPIETVRAELKKVGATSSKDIAYGQYAAVYVALNSTPEQFVDDTKAVK